MFVIWLLWSRFNHVGWAESIFLSVLVAAGAVVLTAWMNVRRGR